MNNNWLAQLAPERAPAPPSWWPPAPGWWVLIVLVALAVGVAIWWWRTSTSLRLRRQRRVALKELDRIAVTIIEPQLVANAIQNLLRRFALTLFNRTDVATLSGDAWLCFVAEHSDGALTLEVGRSLLQAAFGAAQMSDQRQQWLAAARAFVRNASPHTSKRPTLVLDALAGAKS